MSNARARYMELRGILRQAHRDGGPIVVPTLHDDKMQAGGFDFDATEWLSLEHYRNARHEYWTRRLENLKDYVYVQAASYGIDITAYLGRPL